MDLIILGAGGQAKDLISNIEDYNLAVNSSKKINIIGCMDDVKGKTLKHEFILGYPVLTNMTVLAKKPYSKAKIICAVGDPMNKINFIEKILKYKPQFANVIHPSVKLSRDTKIGTGVSIFANSVISSFCTIGDHVSINYLCSVNHDCTIGDYSTLCPGVNIGGKVNIQSCVFMGINSCCTNNLTLKKWCVVGAGATVIRDVEGLAVVVGTPQKVIGKRNKNTAVI